MRYSIVNFLFGQKICALKLTGWFRVCDSNIQKDSLLFGNLFFSNDILCNKSTVWQVLTVNSGYVAIRSNSPSHYLL